MKLTLLEYRDILWMVNLSHGQTPMLTGWNSLITDDPLPKQNVLYMENLALPHTRLDVLAETPRKLQLNVMKGSLLCIMISLYPKHWHGSTARFWILYVKLIHLYMMLIRACKISSLELFTYILV